MQRSASYTLLDVVEKLRSISRPVATAEHWAMLPYFLCSPSSTKCIHLKFIPKFKSMYHTGLHMWYTWNSDKCFIIRCLPWWTFSPARHSQNIMPHVKYRCKSTTVCLIFVCLFPASVLLNAFWIFVVFILLNLKLFSIVTRMLV